MKNFDYSYPNFYLKYVKIYINKASAEHWPLYLRRGYLILNEKRERIPFL